MILTALYNNKCVIHLVKSQIFVYGFYKWLRSVRFSHKKTLYSHQGCIYLKGSSDATCTLQVVWTEMCVGSVCTQPPYNDIILMSLNNFFFLISNHSQMPVCVTSQKPRPSHDCWLTLAFYLRPTLSELSSVRHSFTAGAGVDKNVS